MQYKSSGDCYMLVWFSALPCFVDVGPFSVPSIGGVILNVFFLLSDSVVIGGPFVWRFKFDSQLSSILGVAFCCYLNEVFLYISTCYEDWAAALAFLRITSFCISNTPIVLASIVVAAW